MPAWRESSTLIRTTSRSPSRLEEAPTPVPEVAYAHSLAGRPQDEWETLPTHLATVATLAGNFADAFGAREWGELAGGWHDLGKYSDAFQEYIRRTGDTEAGERDQRGGRRVDHSTFGAQHAARAFPGPVGQLLAFVIAGHHAGLPDFASGDESSHASTLQARLALGPPRVPPVDLPSSATMPGKPRLPFNPAPADAAFEVSLFTRMLFSCLVDADRLGTEAFCDRDAAAARAVARPGLGEIQLALDGHLDRKVQAAASTAVNRVRAEVLDACREAASQAPGFFSLTVPTGGGKTYASLSFALRHACAHGLRRVVIAIPFTTIVEQTAEAYRDALGALADAALVEHHSNRDPDAGSRANRLATENWDAPLIVTTNVQLFESLFASATTPCRKIHRLARSVIILDEAQTLPVDLLAPTLAALRALVQRFACTVVLCTATQPALERRDGFAIGLTGVRPIVADPVRHFDALRRVTVTRLGSVQDDGLAAQLAAAPSALCIVNTRRHASALFRRLCELRVGETPAGNHGVFHLSTYMCAAHRRTVLREIRQRMEEKRPCHVVSTQLIEAGVDVDFPVVFRAPTGFDSVAQAAGRCNREGRFDTGHVYLFDTIEQPPPGMLRRAADTARELAGRYPDPLHPDAIGAYFRQLYWSQSHRWDQRGVLPLLRADFTRHDGLEYRFRRAADQYQIIENGQCTVVVPYGESGRRLVRELLRGDVVTGATYRALQPFVVNVYKNEASELSEAGVIVEHDSGLFVLANESAYDRHTGLITARQGMSPDLLIH
ncbi:MAG: CRISPR-associated endonuclease Cas3'' [Gemmatimonadota bacterium]|nr:CRISPR-associated endonuclease Cas3'' [Gemmatimonadota bacterium]